MRIANISKKPLGFFQGPACALEPQKLCLDTDLLVTHENSFVKRVKVETIRTKGDSCLSNGALLPSKDPLPRNSTASFQLVSSPRGSQMFRFTSLCHPRGV